MKCLNCFFYCASYDKPIGIVTERDLVRKVCASDASGNTIQIKDILSSPLTTIDALSSVEEAADAMIQNKIRHLLVVEDDNKSKPLGIITPTDLVGYLKENLNIDDINAKILRSMQVGRVEQLQKKEKDDKVVEDLKVKDELPINPQKGGEEFENEQPRQGA
ncbi:CBS domain-containing protein [Nitrososphaera sp. AFS]|uniref:CBS domain-containing protein n=1 Tax=Nitrososphaera sp. AFS TaxID=2301191 RepID=UPI0013922EF7|nr:CBS domain-containing protein [Nitrososphaera sp. AFS]